MSAPALSDRDLIDLLRARGRRVTSQRLVIHRALRESSRHLTAEDVREAVEPELPGISTPTVYATLDLLVELGLLSRVRAGPGATLYDARPEPHHHLVCRRCGGVEDVVADGDVSAIVAAAARGGFQVEQADVVLSGLCRGCAAA